MVDIDIPETCSVSMSDDTLTVELKDGRTLSVPLSWYPRLLHATSQERNNRRLIDGGKKVHWKNIDEDISISCLIAGKPSQEKTDFIQ
ncbi:MAG: DUF2442 domain-containing protein [Chitinivibrionales bacterium]|nr:DUF2442 domain-containing protein [Chitinivibrionales bacterium]